MAVALSRGIGQRTVVGMTRPALEGLQELHMGQLLPTAYLRCRDSKEKASSKPLLSEQQEEHLSIFVAGGSVANDLPTLSPELPPLKSQV